MRLPARFLLTGAAVFALSSCASEQVAAPGVPTVTGNPVLRALAVETTYDFVVPASGATINILGAYTLDFPAGSICDPSAADTQAGYAAEDWDAPCTVATGAVSVRATLKFTGGRLYADFQPALRFAPNTTVTIGTGLLAPIVQFYQDAGVTRGWRFDYATGIGAPGVTDALSDPSLRTVVVGSTGRVFRRIKHFSGYQIWLDGQWVPCDPNEANPLCVWRDAETEFGGGGQ